MIIPVSTDTENTILIWNKYCGMDVFGAPLNLVNLEFILPLSACFVT
jgi:hypothetical protein